MSRTPAGVPTGGQFAASQRAEATVSLDVTPDPTLARIFEERMGCGPGEVHTVTEIDRDGHPYEVPYDQTCRSSAHNWARWNGRCEFAADLADAVPDPERRQSEAQARLAHLTDWFDQAASRPGFTGNYDADMAAGHAWHEAADYVRSVAEHGIPQPREPETSNEPPF